MRECKAGKFSGVVMRLLVAVFSAGNGPLPLLDFCRACVL